MRTAQDIRQFLADHDPPPITLLEKQQLVLAISPPNSLDLKINRNRKSPQLIDRLMYTYRAATPQNPLDEELFWWARYDSQHPMTRTQASTMLETLGFNGEKMLAYITPEKAVGAVPKNYPKPRKVATAPIYTATLSLVETVQDALIVTVDHTDGSYVPIDGVYLGRGETEEKKLAIRWIEEAPGRYWWPNLRVCDTQPFTPWALTRLRESLQELGFRPDAIDIAFSEVLKRRLG